MIRAPEAENLLGWMPIAVRAPGLSEFERGRG
jgi:hypothetical protein